MNNKIPTNNVKDTVQKYGSNAADFLECLLLYRKLYSLRYDWGVWG